MTLNISGESNLSRSPKYGGTDFNRKRWIGQNAKHTIPLSESKENNTGLSVSSLFKLPKPVDWNVLDIYVLAKRNLGLWIEGFGGVVIIFQRGNSLRQNANTLRVAIDRHQPLVFVYPEEALFLMERGSLFTFECLTGNLLSIQEIYERLFSYKFSNIQSRLSTIYLSAYIAYADLRRRGIQLKRQDNAQIDPETMRCTIETTCWRSMQLRISEKLHAIKIPRPKKNLNIFDSFKDRTVNSVLSTDQYQESYETLLSYDLSIPESSLHVWDTLLVNTLPTALLNAMPEHLSPQKSNATQSLCLVVLDPDTEVSSYFKKRSMEHECAKDETFSTPILFGLSSGLRAPVFLCGRCLP